MDRAAVKSDFPPKRLDRQLDFEDLKFSPLNVALPLPEQLKSKRKSRTDRHTLLSPSPRPSLPRVKLEFQSEGACTTTEVKDGATKELKGCKCKQSRCIKLYCECFSSGRYCEECSCFRCQNNVENEAARAAAIGSILERNPNAFRRKITNSPHTTHDYEAEAKITVPAVQHKGCQCKKSGCLKRYCECFEAKILCSESCKCVDCKNLRKREERSALLKGRNPESMAFIKQTNASITGTTGISRRRSSRKSRKRKYQDKFPGSSREDQRVLTLLKDSQNDGSAALASSKITCRSFLAGTIQQHDTMELCSILVEVSQAAAILADQNSSVDIQNVRANQTASFTTNLDGENCHKGPEVHKATPKVYLGRDQENKNTTGDTHPGDADVQQGMPISPETLALLCDEENITFMEDVLLDQINNYHSNTDISVVQERLVLLKFREYLHGLMTHGNIKEIECYLSAEANTNECNENLSNLQLKSRVKEKSEGT